MNSFTLYLDKLLDTIGLARKSQVRELNQYAKLLELRLNAERKRSIAKDQVQDQITTVDPIAAHAPTREHQLAQEIQRLQKHSAILAAIHAEQKAHVKALFNAWQAKKAETCRYRPDTKKYATAVRASNKARMTWKAANEHFLKHFGDYAP